MIKKINQKDYKISNWSGGTTTELFIYPIDKSLSEQNFEYRVSTAKIEIKESKFTKMNDYKRIIMTLDNEVELSHFQKEELIEEIKLKPYIEHKFLGRYDTFCKGKCTDFNLIYKDKYEGELIKIENDTVSKIKKDCHYLFYINVDNVKIKINEEIMILEKYETLIVKDEDSKFKFISDNNLNEIGVYIKIKIK